LSENPQLRYVDVQPVVHQGQPMWYLRDPLALSEQQLVMPQGLAPLLMLLDGTRDAAAVHTEFCRMVGGDVPLDVITAAIAQLDAACLLENGNAQRARTAKLAEYRALPHRPPTFAGLSYPDDPFLLNRTLDGYGRDDDLNGWKPWNGRGLIAPHIDFPRGGHVYARVWQRARAAVLAADLILIFGTDHNGGPGTFTLTRQHYATPYGVVPTDTALVDQLADAIGPDAAFAEELHHRQEHSLEFAVVWLHHVYQQAGVPPRPVVPILVGSFHHFMHNGSHPATDPLLQTAINRLKAATADKKVLAIASVDFAHVGPAFNDSFNMDTPRRTALREADQQLIEAIIRGDEARFYDRIAAVNDQNRICGFSPIYLLLQYLETTAGISIAYDQCAADEDDHSLVSIAGILLE